MERVDNTNHGEATSEIILDLSLEWRRFNRVGGNLIRPLKPVAAARNETTENDIANYLEINFSDNKDYNIIIYIYIYIYIYILNTKIIHKD